MNRCLLSMMVAVVLLSTVATADKHVSTRQINGRCQSPSGMLNRDGLF